jgi:hypothetical protein
VIGHTWDRWNDWRVEEEGRRYSMSARALEVQEREQGESRSARTKSRLDETGLYWADGTCETLWHSVYCIDEENGGGACKIFQPAQSAYGTLGVFTLEQKGKRRFFFENERSARNAHFTLKSPEIVPLAPCSPVFVTTTTSAVSLQVWTTSTRQSRAHLTFCRARDASKSSKTGVSWLP